MLTNEAPQFLIADDSWGKRESLKCLASIAVPHIRIIEASDTHQAIRTIQEHAPLVAGFIDYDMPSDNGPAVIRAWRQIEQQEGRTRAKIALVTGISYEEFARCEAEALEAGADKAIWFGVGSDDDVITNFVKEACVVSEK